MVFCNTIRNNKLEETILKLYKLLGSFFLILYIPLFGKIKQIFESRPNGDNLNLRVCLWFSWDEKCYLMIIENIYDVSHTINKSAQSDKKSLNESLQKP